MIVKFSEALANIAKFAVLGAMICIVVTMIFATWDLVLLITHELLTPDPNVWTVSVLKTLDFFSHTLTIVVGYELLKSVKLMITSPRIPLSDITKIAAIALLNKFITADYHTYDAARLGAMSLALLTLAAAGWLFVRTSAMQDTAAAGNDAH